MRECTSGLQVNIVHLLPFPPLTFTVQLVGDKVPTGWASGMQILVEPQWWFLNDKATRNLDLSSMTFEQFVKFFFAREVVPDEQQYACFSQDLSGQKFDEAVPSSPTVIVEHLTRMFSEFGGIAPKYSLAQLDQGIWGIFGTNLRLQEFFWDSSVTLEVRIQCIRSMYSVFADFVAVSEAEILGTGFFMWWDLILFEFWFEQSYQRKLPAKSYELLSEDDRALADVMFEVLTRILDLPDTSAQDCALHGLGHLHHPGVREIVQKFIDHHKIGVTEERLQWLEGCRDCKIM